MPVLREPVGILPLNGAPPGEKGGGAGQRRRPRIFPKTSEGEQHSEEGRREGKLEGEGREWERSHERAPAINEDEDDGGIRGWRVAREEGAAGRRRGFPSFLVKAREQLQSLL